MDPALFLREVNPSLLLGAMALGGIGALGQTAANNKYLSQNIQADMQQLQQDAEAARLRNQVLDKYREIARGFATENQGNFQGGLASFTPEAQSARLGAAEGARGAAIGGAIGAGPNTDIAMRKSAPSFVKNNLQSELGDAFTRAQGQGGRLASVGAYGDTLASNERDISATGQKVKTVNQLATGNAALLPYEQDLVAYKANRPIWRPAQPDVPWWAQLSTSLGNLGGSAAGSGIFDNKHKGTIGGTGLPGIGGLY